MGVESCKIFAGNKISKLVGARQNRIGKRFNSPIWFKLSDSDDIATIFSNSSNLKDVTNDDGKSYRIQEFMNEETREKQTRQRDLIADNRHMPISHQFTMKKEKKELMINGEKYEKKISPPALKEVLLTEMEDEISIENANIVTGSSKEVNRSIFYAYCKEVNTFEDIQEAYRVIKNDHISSTHIVCGYRLFNTRSSSHQDFSDDGETGAGRRLLEVIREMNIWNMAVFIVRYHEGPNLGKQRFELYSELAKDVITSVPRTLNYGQRFKDKELLKAFKKAETQKAKLRNKWKKKSNRQSSVSDQSTTND